MQDPYSGYSYPGFAETEPLGEPVYDGLGNPLGFLPIISAIAPAIAGGISRLIPGLTGGQPPVPVPARVPTPFTTALPPRPFPYFRPPWPLGWQRPQLPYTGLGPRRLYMRCAVWPGPRGLVPAFAQTAQAAALQQAMALQQAAQMAAGRGRYRRRRRRR